MVLKGTEGSYSIEPEEEVEEVSDGGEGERITFSSSLSFGEDADRVGDRGRGSLTFSRGSIGLEAKRGRLCKEHKGWEEGH